MESDVTVETSLVGPVVRPAQASDRTVLYMHGNPDLTDGPESALQVAERLSRETGANVVCCRYRTPFPTALADVHEAYRCAQGFGPVALAGERMGAGLAAALLVHLRDLGAQPPECAVFTSALLDLTMQSRSLFLNASTDPSFEVRIVRRRVADYAGGAPLTDSRVNPLYANLHGLPPIQVLVAASDPLLDDSMSFTARAAHDRVPVDLRVWPTLSGFRAERLTAMAAFLRAQQSRTESPHLLAG